MIQSGSVDVGSFIGNLAQYKRGLEEQKFVQFLTEISIGSQNNRQGAENQGLHTHLKREHGLVVPTKFELLAM